MPPVAVADHLARILAAEQVEFDGAALALIGKSAAGSMRDALSLLDQAIAFGGGSVREDAVREMLGVVDAGWITRLMDAVLAGDGPALVAAADDMAAAGAPFARVLDELAVWLQRVALCAAGAAGEEEADWRPYAAQMAPEDLQVYYQIVIHGARDLSLAPDEQIGFTMTLLRLLAFRPDTAGAGGAPAPSAAPARPPAPLPMPASVARPTARAVAGAPLPDRPASTSVPPRSTPSRPAAPGAPSSSAGIVPRDPPQACAPSLPEGEPSRGATRHRRIAGAGAACASEAGPAVLEQSELVHHEGLLFRVRPIHDRTRRQGRGPDGAVPPRQSKSARSAARQPHKPPRSRAAWRTPVVARTDPSCAASSTISGADRSRFDRPVDSDRPPYPFARTAPS
jgi:DNA polymerase-3 subunit gamma/tau